MGKSFLFYFYWRCFIQMEKRLNFRENIRINMKGDKMNRKRAKIWGKK